MDADALTLLDDVDDVISALGGTGVTARRFKVAQPTVSTWSARGFIPPEWYVVVERALRQDGFSSDPVKVFRMRGTVAPTPP